MENKTEIEFINKTNLNKNFYVETICYKNGYIESYLKNKKDDGIVCSQSGQLTITKKERRN